MTGKDACKRNKTQKQSYKQNYLPTDKRTLSDNSPDSSSSETDTKNTSGQSGVANRPPGANDKKLRTFNDEKDMDKDFANTPNNSEQFFDAENTLSVDTNSGSITAATAGTGSTAPGSTPADSTSRVSVPNQETVHSNAASANKETPSGPANSQSSYSNVSQHDKSLNNDDDDVIMNNSNTSAHRSNYCKSDTNRFHA